MKILLQQKTTQSCTLAITIPSHIPHPTLKLCFMVPFQGSSQLLSCIVQHVGKSLNSLPPPPPFPLYVSLYCKQSKTRDNLELALTPGMSKIPGKRLLQLGTQTAANANCMGSIPYTIFSAKDKPSSSKLENQYPILTTHGSPFGRVEFLLQHTYPRALCHPVFQWWQERHPMTSLDLPPLLQSCTR